MSWSAPDTKPRWSRWCPLQITDPGPRAVGTWSIGETALHVAGSGGYFLGGLRGDLELVRLNEVAAHNAGVLAGNPERDPQVLVERMTMRPIASGD